MILIFVSKITPRVTYIFDLVFKELLRIPYTLTQDQAALTAHEGAKISYGNRPQADELFFEAADLLFEKEIYKQLQLDTRPSDTPQLFKVNSGAMSFDVFAASFYLVTRYEEYLTHFKDRHGRYKVEDSIAYKSDFISKPVVNIWVNELRQLLKTNFPFLEFPNPTFTFTPTIDIDNAYAYKYKGFIRSFAACIALLLKLKLSAFWQRILVHFGINDDPYDTYDKQVALHEKYKVKPLYFVLLGHYSRHDTNLSPYHPKYISLIKKLDSEAEVCMHPSYRAATNIAQMKTEKSRLEAILGRPVTKSRVHYIKITLPETYRMLSQIGITHDYSMGYASQPGFRASIASPFYFYDLEKEEATTLLVHPFAVMDTTLKKYLHIRAKDLMDYLYPLIEETRAAYGNFTFIFHNESMGGAKVWKNWGSVYEDFMKTLQGRRSH